MTTYSRSTPPSDYRALAAARPAAATGLVDGKTVHVAPKCACGRTLAEYLTPPYSLRCHKCKAENRSH